MKAVPAEDLSSKEQELAATKRHLSQAKGEAKKLLDQTMNLESRLRVAEDQSKKTRQEWSWTSPYLAELLAGRHVLGKLTFNTLTKWAKFGIGHQLGVPTMFKNGINPAGLYWALTHASATGQKGMNRLDGEDAITTNFVSELQRELAAAKSLLGASLEVSAGEIHKKLRPALKEISVGSDLLLLISGDALVPGGGVRLLWLQVKLSSEGNPLVLDVFRKPNSADRTQLDVLRTVDIPSRGSFGMYALASREYRFFTSIPVSGLGSVLPTSRSSCIIDLSKSDTGVRLQELILALVSDPNYGQFEKADEVVHFIDKIATESAIIPLTVLSVSAGSELVPSKNIVQTVKETWDKRLEAHFKSLNPNLKSDRQMKDEGPSLSL